MQNIIAGLINVILGSLSRDTFKSVVDKLLDKIEDSVKDSSNKIDDMLVLPLTAKIRELLDVEDNDPT